MKQAEKEKAAAEAINELRNKWGEELLANLPQEMYVAILDSRLHCNWSAEERIAAFEVCQALPAIFGHQAA